MSWLKRFMRSDNNKLRQSAQRLHHSVVEKARTPDLYGEGLIPDTLEGRFHAIALYSGLLLPRLEKAGTEGRDLSRLLNDKIFDSFDAALRETGVGDASIARKIRKMGETFVGVGQAVALALGSPDPGSALTQTIERNAIASGAGADKIAKTLLEDAVALSEATHDDILTGQLPW
ncbi:ubiquinol-cytochrome C chaperone family protein [Henriciella sp.]|uniref:ubiquinol-cytochrome C chaperone family protein n=1 Tax=Henriciella sp. TaxID=1968823 RepID=UPI0026229E08|nr:ubiquinol-cytochrome C chaperone family protein [Henriciella sp.]